MAAPSISIVPNRLRLNLGCSDAHVNGWLNVDLCQPADVIADLSERWPWEDSSVDEIYAADIFEHIGDCPHTLEHNCERCNPFFEDGPLRHWSGRIHVMNESWRVLKPGGILTMECPDAAKGAGHFQDPTHVTPWTPNGLQYYTDGSPAHTRFAKAYGITARFKRLGVMERMYREAAGDVNCEVWKFTARLEAVK